MNPKLIVIDKTQIAELQQLLVYLNRFDTIAYDCETTGLNKSSTVIGFSVCAEESTAYYVIMHRWNSQSNKLEGEYSKECLDILNLLKTKDLIMHNAVFDSMLAEYAFKIRLIDSVVVDTMVLAHLLDENRKVGLKELGKSYLGENTTQEQIEMKASIAKNGGSASKINYELYKADAELVGKYGAKDSWITYMLYNALLPELVDQNLVKFFTEESMPLLRGPTYQLNTSGLRIEQPILLKLKKDLEAECLKDLDFIYKEINSKIKDEYPNTTKTNKFNIKSNPQLAWLLFNKYDLRFSTLTKEGKTICKYLGLRLPYSKSDQNDFINSCINREGEVYHPEAIVNSKKIRAKKIAKPWKYIMVDKKTLEKHSSKYKWVDRLLKYNKNLKLLNTYVEGIENKLEYGIIQPSFLQHGTTSGRYSSRNPNFQNLPRDDKRIKQCIVARNGKVFVGADYSQLEPRVFAYYSDDKRLLSSFKSNEDFYSTIGMEVYDKKDCTASKEENPDSFKVKYKHLRNPIKVFALASVYGASANQLSPTIGKSIEETQEDLNTYFERFPGVKKYMLESYKLAKTEGQVTNLFGRPRRIPKAKEIEELYKNLEHGQLPYEARTLLNLATNHRIQSTAASIVNRAAIRFLDNAKQAQIECQLALQVHDSLIIECNEKDAENVAILLQDAMENTIDLKTIKLEAIPKIGKTLADV